MARCLGIGALKEVEFMMYKQQIIAQSPTQGNFKNNNNNHHHQESKKQTKTNKKLI